MVEWEVVKEPHIQPNTFYAVNKDSCEEDVCAGHCPLLHHLQFPKLVSARGSWVWGQFPGGWKDSCWLGWACTCTAVRTWGRTNGFSFWLGDRPHGDASLSGPVCLGVLTLGVSYVVVLGGPWLWRRAVLRGGARALLSGWGRVMQHHRGWTMSSRVMGGHACSYMGLIRREIIERLHRGVTQCFKQSTGWCFLFKGCSEKVVLEERWLQ